LANGALRILTAATLAVSSIGQAVAKALEILPKSEIKQVDRLLTNFAPSPATRSPCGCTRSSEERREIVVAMDWTDFDSS